MIDFYLSALTSGWWMLGYFITLGIMIGLHESDLDTSFKARCIVGMLVFIVAYFVYPIFLGMFITRCVK